MKKINILLLLTGSSVGGAERIVLNHIRHYDKNRFNLHVAVLRQGNLEEEFKKTAKQNNVVYACLRLKSRISFAGLLKLKRIIKKNNIKLVHSHLIEADMYAFLLKFLCPAVRFVSTRHAKDDFREKIWWGFFNYMLSAVDDKIVCVAHSTKRFIHNFEYIPNRKLITIYAGVDIAKFVSKKNPLFRKKIGANKNEFLIGIVGRLSKEKGHRHLFRALKILKDERITKFKLAVIGDGPLAKQLKAMRDMKGLQKEIIFWGFRKDINKIYSNFDLLCVPSDFEGFGLVIIEAMACNTPSLASDIDAIKEIITDKKTGFLFKSGSSDDLADKLRNILRKKIEIKSFSKNAKNLIRKKFNFTINLKKLETVYLQILWKK
ncbi:glycosyltransferase [Candidatus Woesearchaeota archaeon]|nr:glycosyltransferase [Candidatus Woesearchaeota archaeon]